MSRRLDHALTAERPSQQLIDIVAALGGTWTGYVAMCRCPAHDDSDPSLSLRQGHRDILVKCFAGCDSEDVLRELRRIRITKRYDPPAVSPAPRAAKQGSDVRGTLAEEYLHRRRLLPVPSDIRFTRAALSSEAANRLPSGAAGRRARDPHAGRDPADIPRPGVGDLHPQGHARTTADGRVAGQGRAPDPRNCRRLRGCARFLDYP